LEFHLINEDFALPLPANCWFRRFAHFHPIQARALKPPAECYEKVNYADETTDDSD
jgi:hypothetical protein